MRNVTMKIGYWIKFAMFEYQKKVINGLLTGVYFNWTFDE